MNRFTHSFHKEFPMSKSNNRRRNSQKSAALGAYFPEDLRQKLSEDLQLSGMAIVRSSMPRHRAFETSAPPPKH